MLNNRDLNIGYYNLNYVYFCHTQAVLILIENQNNILFRLKGDSYLKLFSYCIFYCICIVNKVC